MEGVIARFKQQINENSNWDGHIFPEMNQARLVGWAGGKEEYAVIIFRSFMSIHVHRLGLKYVKTSLKNILLLF